MITKIKLHFRYLILFKNLNLFATYIYIKLFYAAIDFSPLTGELGW